tara:strand:+ start:35 stop:292 length:258 start_codon:yes stop_codon:yes gene_type:complete
MTKLIVVSAFGLLCTGAFASNDEAKTETIKYETETSATEALESEKSIDAVRATITVNCDDGSSYEVSCGSCITSQLIGIAVALCA